MWQVGKLACWLGGWLAGQHVTCKMQGLLAGWLVNMSNAICKMQHDAQN